MKSNTQNAKIEAITEKTLVLGIDVGSETHYARAFDYSMIRKRWSVTSRDQRFIYRLHKKDK